MQQKGRDRRGQHVGIHAHLDVEPIIESHQLQLDVAVTKVSSRTSGISCWSRMDDIRASLRDTWFAWSGPTTNGSAAYFRIQGPTLVIEYSPQDSGADHIHTIYRDPTNDYGAKFARQ